MSDDFNENKKKDSIRELKKREFKRKLIKILIMFIIVLVLGIIAFRMLKSYEVCDNWDCFNENLASCSRTKFAGGKEIIFRYTIEGFQEDKCKIEVEFLQGELGGRPARELEQKKMTCYTPQGIVMLPESDLSNCSGELKEKLLEEIINQLHNYIVQNIGQIKKELLNPLL